jgi:broad specificity phosphatase PhoE
VEAPVELLIARHPETVANAEGRFLGALDAPLSPLGREQALALQSAIDSWGPDVIVSSPAGRALRIARAVARDRRVPLVVDTRLVEIGLGAVDGLTHEEAAEKGLRMDGVCETAGEAPFEGGETWDSFLGRVGAAVAEAADRGERIALVTHAGPLRAMLVDLLGLPWSAGWRFSLPPASTAELDVSAPAAGQVPERRIRGSGVLVRFGPL